MRLEQLKYFVEVVNCKSINKAAQNLYITQPALSMAINSLEEELHSVLLKRTKKGVVLTEKGKKVFGDVQPILHTIEQWYEIKEDEETIFDGEIHILAMPSICQMLSNTIIWELKNTYPELCIFLHEKHTRGIIETLESSSINIGLILWPNNDLEKLYKYSEKFRWNIEKIGQDKMKLFISVNNKLAVQDKIEKYDLKKLNLAGYSDSADFVANTYGEYFNNAQFKLGSRESILQMIAENKAVAIYPYKAMSKNYFFVNNIIKAVDMPDIDGEISYFLVYSKRQILSNNEIKIIEILKQKFRQMI